VKSQSLSAIFPGLLISAVSHHSFPLVPPVCFPSYFSKQPSNPFIANSIPLPQNDPKMRQDDEGRLPRKPRGKRRDRDCRSCKSRGVKCDLNRPRCRPCVESGLPCGGYPQRLVWTAEAVAGRGVPSQQKRRKLSYGHLEVPTSLQGQDVLVQNAGVSQTNDCSTPERYSLIKRLEVFCHDIESIEGYPAGSRRYFSAEALRLINRISDFTPYCCPDPTHESIASQGSIASVQHHLAALNSLIQALDTANPVAFLGIAAFAFFEVCHGSFGEWQRHLHGARSLLDYHCRTRSELDRLSEEVIGLTEIVAHLVWFDALGAIIRGTTGLIFDDWHRQTLSPSFFSGVGCPAETFNFLVEVARVGTVADPLALCFQAIDQLCRLDSDPTDQGQAVNAYRCAAAIALLTRIEVGEETMAALRQAALASAVDRVCRIIASIPTSSRFYMHLAVTAYLAGTNATTVDECSIVRTYWQNCQITDFPHYPDGLARCEEKWKVKGLV
jgi:hypothetical protein